MTTYAQHPDDRKLGDVGHGSDFGLDLYYLFKAGKVHIPDTAVSFAEAAGDVHNATGALEGLAANGGERAMTRLLELREELHVALRRTALNMHETGDAVVDTAKEYLRTDETALARFQELRDSRRHEDDFRGLPDFVPPPRPGDTPPNESPNRYGLPGRA